MKHAWLIVLCFFLANARPLNAQPRPVVVTPAGQAPAPGKTAAPVAVSSAPIEKPAAPKASPSNTPSSGARFSSGSDDRVIEAKLRAKLAKSKVGSDGFTFQVRDGIVTWEGETDVGQHKGAATRMAKTAGAHAVVNNIIVHGSGKSRGASRGTSPSAARSSARSDAR